MNRTTSEIRVSVVGSSGSGKTTLAGHLAGRFGIAHHELDSVHWQPDWTPLPVGDFRRTVATLASGREWVIDGNYSAVRSLVWQRATAIVWLDLPLPLVLWRSGRRTIHRIVHGGRLWNDNRETIRGALTADGVLRWTLRHHRRRRREYAGTLGGLPHAVVHRLTSRVAIGAWMESVQAGDLTGSAHRGPAC